MHDQSVCDDCLHIRFASNNDVYNSESVVRLLFWSNDLHTVGDSVCNGFVNSIAVYNTFVKCITYDGSVAIGHSIADADAIPSVVSRIDWVLSQFNRYIHSGPERPDTVSLREYGNQPHFNPVLAADCGNGDVHDCSHGRGWRKFSWRNYSGIKDVFSCITWKFSDLFPAGCNIHRS
jgi:hypothetical protein